MLRTTNAMRLGIHPRSLYALRDAREILAGEGALSSRKVASPHESRLGDSWSPYSACRDLPYFRSCAS